MRRGVFYSALLSLMLLLGTGCAPFQMGHYWRLMSRLRPTPTPLPTATPIPSPTLTPSPSPTPTFTPSPSPTLTPTPSLTDMCWYAHSSGAIRVQAPCRWSDIGEAYQSAYSDGFYWYSGFASLMITSNKTLFVQHRAPGIFISALREAAQWYGVHQLLQQMYGWKIAQVRLFDNEKYIQQFYFGERFEGEYERYEWTAPPAIEPQGDIWFFAIHPPDPDLVPDYVIGIVMKRLYSEVPDADWEVIRHTLLQTLTVHSEALP